MSMRLLSVLGIALSFFWTPGVGAEEIPAAQVVKVSHAEGYRVKTATYDVSVAIVWRKGVKKQDFLMLVQHQQEPIRYFTISKPSPVVEVGEGDGIKVILDNKRQVLIIQSGSKKIEEKFTQVIDS